MLELWTREMAKGECHCMSTRRAGLSTVKSVKTHWLCQPLKRKNDLNVNTLKHVQKRVNKESKQLVSVCLPPRVFVRASNGSGNSVAVFRAKQPAHLNKKNNNEDIQINNTKQPLCFHKLTTESKQQLNRNKKEKTEVKPWFTTTLSPTPQKKCPVKHCQLITATDTWSAITGLRVY